VVIEVLFVLSITCVVALISVGIAIHFRVKRHLRQDQIDAQVRSTIEEAAENAAEEKTP
jgi:hypothetical protein